MNQRGTWGHSIEILGPAARTWLRAGPQHLYLLRYAKRISRRFMKHVDQPATTAQAKAFAKRYQLDLPQIVQDEPQPPLINTPRPSTPQS